MLRKEEAGSHSKFEFQKPQRQYTQGGGAFGFVRNLVKTSILPVSKLRQILHSKSSKTKFTLTTPKCKQTMAFSRLKKELWCMDLAYVDKLAKDKNGVKYLLVCQHLFDRTIDAKGRKRKDAREIVLAFFNYDYTRKSTQKIWMVQGTETAGEYKKT